MQADRERLIIMIETNRCKLLKIANEDHDDVKRLYQDETVRKYLGGAVDDERFNTRFAEMTEADGGSFYWGIRLKDTDEFLGMISIDMHHDGENREVSYGLLPKYWGQGYATEIVRKVIEHGFKELGLSVILAETQSANENSCKLLKRVGMILKEKRERFGAEQSIFMIRRKENV